MKLIPKKIKDSGNGIEIDWTTIFVRIWLLIMSGIFIVIVLAARFNF